MDINKDERLKIILVDDNVTFRSTIKRFLQEEFQYNVIGEASGGEEFFSITDIVLADVILMDLQMPEMDGYAITKKLLMDYRNLPIVAITMHTEKAYLQELIEVGFKGCIFKPDFYESIEDAIHAVTNKKYYFPKDIKL